jgi:hypothetical protein
MKCHVVGVIDIIRITCAVVELYVETRFEVNR